MSDMIALMYYCTKDSCPSLKRKQIVDVEVEGEKLVIPSKGGAVEILLRCTHNLEDELVLAFCPCIYRLTLRRCPLRSTQKTRGNPRQMASGGAKQRYGNPFFNSFVCKTVAMS
jgi:hypothetical protein